MSSISRPAVVFDFGGVLFRWRPPVLLARCLPQRVTDEASAAHWVQQFFQGYQGDWLEFDRGTVSVPDLVQRIAARTGLHPHEVQAVVDAVPDELQPLPESVALLRSLHAAGTPLHYLSNMSVPYAAHLEQRHDFLRLFGSGVFSGREQVVKPEPAIFALAQARFGRDPQELIFLDDHPANVEAARAAGWQALWFDTAQGVRQALRDRGVAGA